MSEETATFDIIAEAFDGGTTFVSVDDAPYWVTDRLESNYLFAGDLEKPDPGERSDGWTVRFDPDDQTILGVSA